MVALQEASEVFLTSSTRDVQGLHAVDDRELAGAPGPITTEAARVFAARAAADVDP
jgi:branched-chain amino acid aminotransferase